MADEDLSTGQITINTTRIFKQDVDPGDEVRPGDEWHHSADVVKVRNYAGDGWLTVSYT